MWWASAFEHQRKQFFFDSDHSIGLSEKYIIKALRGIRYTKNVSLKRYLDHRLVARKFARFAVREEPPDLIVASMPSYDLAYEGMRYAKERNIPMVVDVRDMWPDVFLTRLCGLKKRIASFMLAGDFNKLRFLLKNASAITAMSDGILSWAMGYAERARTEGDRVFHLGYRPVSSIDESLVGAAIRQLLERLNGNRICLYIGTHGDSYELPLVIEAAKKFFQRAPEYRLHFVIAGQGEQTQALKEMSAGLDNVSFTGWLNSHEIALLLRHSYLGIVPCKSVYNAYPNKPFEYFSAGLPIVSSIEGELASLIDEEGIGFNYLPGDAAGLCRGIVTLAKDPDLREKMARNAKEVFVKNFDAKSIYTDYVDYAEMIVGLYKGGSIY